MRVSRLVIPLGVGHAEVFLAAIDELLPELAFELRISSILLRLGCHVVPILDLLFLGLSKAIEVGL